MDRFPPRRILVPVDFSPASSWAWSWAKRLGGRSARLEALHVTEPYPAPVVPEMPAAAAPPVPDRASVLAAVRRQYPGGEASAEVGLARLAIVRAARRADLVVMGTHGRGGFERALLGSVCEAVMRDCPAPVLAVREAPGRVESVLAPVNLEPYSRAGLELGARLAAALGARLAVLHVAPDAMGADPRPLLELMLKELPRARRGEKPRLIVRYGSPAAEILDEASRHSLVSLTAHRKPLLEELVLGSTVDRTLRYSPVPVLAAPILYHRGRWQSPTPTPRRSARPSTAARRNTRPTRRTTAASSRSSRGGSRRPGRAAPRRRSNSTARAES